MLYLINDHDREHRRDVICTGAAGKRAITKTTIIQTLCLPK